MVVPLSGDRRRVDVIMYSDQQNACNNTSTIVDAVSLILTDDLHN
jgi:hypothetical protein